MTIIVDDFQEVFVFFLTLFLLHFSLVNQFYFYQWLPKIDKIF